MSRAAALGALLVLLPVAVVTHRGGPEEHAPRGADLGRQIPARTESWSSADRTLDDATLRYLKTDDYVYREYTRADGRNVELMLVFSRTERKAVHPPEVCLEAQGWEIEDRGSTTLEAHDGRQVEAATLRLLREGRRLRVVYWYATGSASTPSYVEHQGHVAWASLKGRAAGSALVRLSYVESPETRVIAAAALDDWAHALLPEVLDALSVGDELPDVE